MGDAWNMLQKETEMLDKLTDLLLGLGKSSQLLPKADKSHSRSHTYHFKANIEEMVSGKIAWWRKMGKENLIPHNQHLCIWAKD